MSNENMKETKKKKILDSAYRLFLEKGYKNTKIIDIAENAGIGKGTVYEYFGSKAELLIEIISSGMEEYLGDCDCIMAKDSNQADKLLELILIEGKTIKEQGLRLLKLSQAVVDNDDGMPAEFIERMKLIWEKKYNYIKEILLEGIQKGEFREMNLDMATISIMGATSSYLNVKYGICHLKDVELPFDVNLFKQEDLMEILLRGIEA